VPGETVTLREALRLSRAGSALSYKDAKRHPLDYEAQAKEHRPTVPGGEPWLTLCTPDSPQYSDRWLETNKPELLEWFLSRNWEPVAPCAITALGKLSDER